jgi:glycosyltransferase involved in cell wall biosynthesis
MNSMPTIAMVAEHTRMPEHDLSLRAPHLTGLAAALSRAGHEVTLYVRRGQGPAEQVAPDGFRIVRVTGRFRAGLADAMRASRPDVVHAHCASVWEAAAEVAAELDVPFVYGLHGASDLPSTRDHVAGAGVPAARAADHVVAAFSAQVRKLVTAGVPRHKISVVPYGVDTDHFTPDGPATGAGRLPNRIVGLGELVPGSGFGTPVAALRALPDTELLIVGGPRFGTHARELRDYARSLGVANRVHLAGPVPRTELPGLLRSADLLVCSPWEPAFGIAALEAMACGVAVVANRVGGLIDTVVDKVTGSHVTPRKPRELASVLNHLLHHKALCEQQGAAGRDRAWARYGWSRVVADTMRVYERAGLA